MIWKALGKDLYIFWKAPELSKKYAAVAPQVPLLDDELTAGPDDEDALVELEDEELSASEVGMLRAATAGFRTHYAAWHRSQRVKEAVRTAAAGAEVLALLNETTRLRLLLQLR